jgi:lysine-N-methylase
MLIRVPDYYDQFRCLAGACPHSCCEKWEVVIDDDTADRYRQVPGLLGDRLRAALQTDEDGDSCFPLDGGRCPFLDRENLCEIHRQLGEDATSVTCREHPRFTEDYGSFQEVTLSASCPAANVLLLGSDQPLTFREFETAEPGEAGDLWLPYLLALRGRMLDVLADRVWSLKTRLGDFLLLAAEAQDLLDQDRAEELPGLAASWQPRTEVNTIVGENLFPDGLRFLGTLDALESDWRALLAQAETAPAVAVSETALERIAVYFAFRYLLKAVNDGDLLSRAKLCVFAVLTVERLAAVCGLPEALRRFSCEIEHSDENLEALLTVLWQGNLGILPSENDFHL